MNIKDKDGNLIELTPSQLEEAVKESLGITKTEFTDMKTKLQALEDKGKSDLEISKATEKRLSKEIIEQEKTISKLTKDLETSNSKIPKDFDMDKWSKYQEREIKEIRAKKLEEVKTKFKADNKLDEGFEFHTLITGFSEITNDFDKLDVNDSDFEKNALEVYGKMLNLHKEFNIGDLPPENPKKDDKPPKNKQKLPDGKGNILDQIAFLNKKD